MKLKEFEGKQLFEKAGIQVSRGIVIHSIEEIPEFIGAKLLKVQTIAGGRGKAGGIVQVKNAAEAREKATEFLGKEFLGEIIKEIIIDDKISIKKELYLGILFNTTKRVPVVIFSEDGGVDIEELKLNSPDKIKIREIDILEGLKETDCESLLTSTSMESKIILQVKEIMHKLWNCFCEFDCKMLEVNPLIITNEDKIVAVDSVIVLDDDANYRREIKFAERTDKRQATKREIAARNIDKDDHRGVAGKTFIDLEGDIAILTSAGGASMTVIDTLVELGGKPANYTEYSGNPPKEKVERLTKIVLDKENLSGLLIAGVIANFTNIKETLEGIMNVLVEQKPNFPIVIRRAGPHDDEAKEMLKEIKEKHKLDIHYYDENTPMTKAAEIMIELSNKYKESRKFNGARQ